MTSLILPAPALWLATALLVAREVAGAALLLFCLWQGAQALHDPIRTDEENA